MIQKILALFLLVFLLKTSVFAQNGLRAEYFEGTDFDRKISTRIDSKIDFKWDYQAPVNGLTTDNFSVRWTGRLKAPESGEYLFRALVDDGIRVEIDQKSVINQWEWNDSKDFAGSIYLEAGREYDLKVEYFNGPNEGEIQLRWQLPSEKPTFGGAFGYNDKPISAKYFFQNPPPNPPSQAKILPKKESLKIEKQLKKPAANPVSPAKTALISKDSLEKYMPKNTLFEKSTAIMLSGSLVELDNLADFLIRNSRFQLRIEGHTDAVGDAAANLTLSRERAKSVADYLVEKGVSENRVAWVGFGGTRPVSIGASAAANARNRRVEYFLK